MVVVVVIVVIIIVAAVVTDGATAIPNFKDNQSSFAEIARRFVKVALIVVDDNDDDNDVVAATFVVVFLCRNRYKVCFAYSIDLVVFSFDVRWLLLFLLSMLHFIPVNLTSCYPYKTMTN